MKILESFDKKHERKGGTPVTSLYTLQALYFRVLVNQDMYFCDYENTFTVYINFLIINNFRSSKTS